MTLLKRLDDLITRAEMAEIDHALYDAIESLFRQAELMENTKHLTKTRILEKLAECQERCERLQKDVDERMRVNVGLVYENRALRDKLGRIGVVL